MFDLAVFTSPFLLPFHLGIEGLPGSRWHSVASLLFSREFYVCARLPEGSVLPGTIALGGDMPRAKLPMGHAWGERGCAEQRGDSTQRWTGWDKAGHSSSAAMVHTALLPL